MKSRAMQPAEARRSQLAGDAVHAEAVGPVGGELDLDHRPFEAQALTAGVPTSASAGRSMIPS